MSTWTDEAVGASLGLPRANAALLSIGRYLRVYVDSSDDLDELTAALTMRRDELASVDERFQVPLLVLVPDDEFEFRTAFHEWKEVTTDEMVRRGWHPSLVKAAAMAR
jgi:hypothetical protein